ncbi:MAG TPA: lipid-binding SYLF domain-containing protein [Vicinamibacterales bacterium]
MRHVIAVSTSVLLLSAIVGAADLSSSETKRLEEASSVVRELRAEPDKGIPDGLWSRAECVAVIPNLKKAAFMVGGEFGKGVLSCHSGAGWSAPVFVEIEKGSMGFQIGGEQVDLVLLVMNKGGIEKMLQDKVNLGGDAAVAAGPVGRMASASTDAQLHAGILAYSRTQGAYAGIDISGGVLRPDKSANQNAYGTTMTPRDVLAKADVVAPPPARAFVQTLQQETRATTGRR